MKASTVSFFMIFGLSILIATPAKSEIIPVVATENDDEKLYIDTDSITFNRNFVEALVKIKYKTPSKTKTSSLAVRWKVNCSSRSYMYVGFNSYDLNGNFLWGDRKPSEWKAIKPGAVNESVSNFMCNFRR